jgi:hypothetical protein
MLSSYEVSSVSLKVSLILLAYLLSFRGNFNLAGLVQSISLQITLI